MSSFLDAVPIISNIISFLTKPNLSIEALDVDRYDIPSYASSFQGGLIAVAGYKKTIIKWNLKNNIKFGLFSMVATNVTTLFSLYDKDTENQIVNARLPACPLIPADQKISQEYEIEDEILKNGNYTFTFSISANNKQITTKYKLQLITSTSNPIRKEE